MGLVLATTTPQGSALDPEGIPTYALTTAKEATEEEMRYPADPESLRTLFRQTGALPLLVPGLGQVVVVGQEISLTSYGNRSMDIPTVQILGSVSGYANSTANILLGEYGIYGSLVVPVDANDTRTIWFDAEEVAPGIYQEWVHVDNRTILDDFLLHAPDRGAHVPGVPDLTTAMSTSASCTSPPKSSQAKVNANAKVKATGSSPASPPDPCSTPDCSGGNGVSWITYHAEKDLRDAHSNWRDRILSAFAGYSPLWQKLCITVRAWPVEAGGGNVLTTDTCGTDRYVDWLRNTWRNNPGFFNDDAYQLWTKRNLMGDGSGPNGAYCFGSARIDQVEVSRTAPKFTAASVVEGYDNSQCCDTYDPDETKQRGVVSGHEMSHVYGEENHPYKCRKNEWYDTAEDCNIMRRCKMVTKVSLFHVQASQQEIMFRYHYNTDTTSGNEGQPDCP